MTTGLTVLYSQIVYIFEPSGRPMCKPPSLGPPLVPLKPQGTLCPKLIKIHQRGVQWKQVVMIYMIGKLNLLCDVIVANHFSHQVIVFE